MDTLTKVNGRWLIGKVCPSCVKEVMENYGFDGVLIKWSVYNEHYCLYCGEHYRVNQKGQIAKC